VFIVELLQYLQVCISYIFDVGVYIVVPIGVIGVNYTKISILNNISDAVPVLVPVCLTIGVVCPLQHVVGVEVFRYSDQGVVIVVYFFLEQPTRVVRVAYYDVVFVVSFYPKQLLYMVVCQVIVFIDAIINSHVY